ncbi:activator-dependent family glycosyltransferase [Actinomadura sp. 1N219]|uniref:activator-dependent family glycosyltransferase n=1 Tax=Actinomadura sp. 1N219 TaxID=3375152 RepID=UPI0037B69115
MRVLFLTVANKSHTYVMAPLAWALRTAGHEVCVVSQPDLVEDITATGLTGVAVGGLQEAEVTAQMNEADPTQAVAAEPVSGPIVRQHQLDYARDDPAGEFASLVANLFPVINPDTMFDDLVGFARDWEPDLVIWDMLTYAGPVAARAAGAAHARLVLATDGVGQLRSHVLERYRETGEDPLRDWLRPKLDRYDCTFGEDIAVGDWTIDPMPSWTWHPSGVNYVPMRHLAFNGPSMAPRWLYEKPERPRVCITLGNSHRDAGRVEASANALIEAVADLDVEVVATLDPKQLVALPSLPANLRAIPFVPLNVLLPSCSAIIHHGGAGTFAGAVEHGVPQLLVPSTWWSEKWYGPVAMANGLEEQKAGAYVCDSDQLSADVLRDALVRVLEDPQFTVNAERLRKETLAMPTPNDIVPVLEKLTLQYRAAEKPRR